MFQGLARCEIKQKQNTDTVLGLFQPYLHIFAHVYTYANETETSLKLFQTVSVFCFSFISKGVDVRNKLFYFSLFDTGAVLCLCVGDG